MGNTPTEKLEHKVRARQLDEAARGQMTNGIGAFSSSLVLALLTRGSTTLSHTLLWLALVAVTSGSFVVASLLYRRRARRPLTSLRPWLVGCYLLSAMHGLAWGSVSVLLNTERQLGDFLLVTLYVLGSGSAQLLAQTTLPWLYLTCFGPIYAWVGVSLAQQSFLSIKVEIAFGVFCVFLLFFSRELTRRFAASLRLGFEHEALSTKLAVAVTDLEIASSQLSELVIRDELTGLYNRRHLFETLGRELERIRRHPAPLTVLLLDLDHFKLVNDRYGHTVGDAVLRRFASMAEKQLRSHDVLARYGGEEFSVLCCETPPGRGGALIVAERIRATIESTSFEDLAPGLRVTVSIGVATHRKDEPGTELYTRADAALYRAKAAGRNRIEE